MEEQDPNSLEEISLVDWERTPASVQKLVEEMALRTESLEKQLAEVLTIQQQLLEKVNRTMQLGRLDRVSPERLHGGQHTFSSLAQNPCKELLITFVQTLGSETDVCPRFRAEWEKFASQG